MRRAKFLLSLLLLLILSTGLLVFFLQNQASVTIVTLFGSIADISLGKALAGVFAVGSLVGFAIGFLPGIADAFKVHRLRQQLVQLQKQLDAAITLQDTQ